MNSAERRIFAKLITNYTHRKNIATTNAKKLDYAQRINALRDFIALVEQANRKTHATNRRIQKRIEDSFDADDGPGPTRKTKDAIETNNAKTDAMRFQHG